MDLIAVTGNSGKTVFSFYLSQVLSKQGKRVFLISSDSGQPAYKMLFPDRKSDEKRSIGRLLSLAAISEAKIFDNAYPINKNLMMLSYADGEGPNTYPEIAEVSLQALLSKLASIADVVIVDTATAQNRIDRFVLSAGSKQIFLATADEKGYSYRQNHKTGADAMQVLFQNSPDNALSDVLETYDSDAPVYLLPYCRGFSGIYNGIDISDVVPRRKYRKTLYQIIGDMK